MLDWLHPYRPYHAYFGRLRRTRLVGRFSIRCIQHHIFRPCRRGLAGLTDVERKHSLYNTLYDATFSLILSGYRRLIGKDIHPETPQMLFLIRRWMRHIDLEFESQLASESTPVLTQINAARDVSVARDRALVFARKYHHDEKIELAVSSFLSTSFDRYLNSINKAMANAEVAAALEMVRLDSGVWLQAVIECVRLFNSHPSDARVDRNFLHLGIAGTLADDLLDVGYDERDGDSNVLVAILRNHGDEYQRMLDGGPGVGGRGQAWWRRNCPNSFLELFSYIEFHHSQIESRHLQFVTDLMLIPPMAGYDYKRSIRTAAKK